MDTDSRSDQNSQTVSVARASYGPWFSFCKVVFCILIVAGIADIFVNIRKQNMFGAAVAPSVTNTKTNTVNAASHIPDGFSIPRSTLSPDGRFGVIAPDFAHYNENSGPQNQLIELNNMRVLTTINADTWVEDRQRTRNHMSLDPHWSKDGSVLGWVLGGKWFPAAFILLKLEDAKVVWQLNVLESVQREILSRTKTAASENYRLAKDQNRGSGSAYPDGFTVDVATPKGSFSLPLYCSVTLTSNPKEISDWPPEANVKASMDAVVERDGSMKFSNFNVDVGRQADSPAVVEDSRDTQENVKTFAASFQKAESNDDLGVNLKKYADTVNYFDNGKVNQTFIKKDKQDYRDRWTIRNDVLTGDIQVTKIENEWSVTYPTHFRVENAKGEWAEGNAENSMKLVRYGSSYKITVQDVIVKNRTKSSGLAISTTEAFPAKAMRGEKFPETRTRIVTIDEIKKWDDDKFRYAINEMYARHGADFNDKDIKRNFLRFNWYHPVLGKTYDQAEANFGPIETQNVKLLGETRNQIKDKPGQTDSRPQNPRPFAGTWKGTVNPKASASGRNDRFDVMIRVTQNGQSTLYVGNQRAASLKLVKVSGDEIQLIGNHRFPDGEGIFTVKINLSNEGQAFASIRTDTANGGWSVMEGSLHK